MNHKTFFLRTRFNTRASHRNKKKCVSCNIDKGKSKKASASCKHSISGLLSPRELNRFFSPSWWQMLSKVQTSTVLIFVIATSFFSFIFFRASSTFCTQVSAFFPTGNVSIVLRGAYPTEPVFCVCDRRKMSSGVQKGRHRLNVFSFPSYFFFVLFLSSSFKVN